MEELNESVEYLKNQGFQSSDIGIICGTGLQALHEDLESKIEIPFKSIPNFGSTTVKSHKGMLCFGLLNGKKTIIMVGRLHLYEGFSFQQVSFGVRVMHAFGIKALLISNAAGAVNPSLKKGELMLISDQINLQGGSPLAFPGVEKFGERFVDMSQPFDLNLADQVKKIAVKNNIDLKTGVYAGVLGPQLETKAEYKILKLLGADAVGMSTIAEVIVARHLNLSCLAISALTDEWDPNKIRPLSIEDVIKIAKQVEPKINFLFKELIRELGN